ncbi:ribokinase [Chryseobacterium sp. WG14]|jgi:ribokinase|uniref:Ribokinase n=1 Tax=Chryseobacterium rhizosphaerae TaxID=395937 RepID=A0AAE4C4J2_9FLAO|nr:MULTISPECIES: ribokinase [Chryseobacterium]MBL3548268.1 ribokinase [Chryseobacterium sp. KMC2]MCQ9635885.1 ribokinase [Chryseobacterium sp. WG23]MCQ9640701.1 ribokinase [Chryseobacterium sp. WG14]MDR6527644.1 ribokinase [Chryseobacterium rhizosphaerae]MDR6548135.1 ribokinase [Chryseobacterium rhizosphaerae]
MKFSSEQPRIIVVGSSSIDLVLETEKLPLPNETVLAVNSDSYFGGKGANQAVGTARLGASVYFIGCVGMDPLGQQIMRNLVSENVNVGFVHETDKESTGTAYVTTCNGNAAIVVVPAANKYLNKAHIDEADRYFHSADLVLVQLEVSIEVVEYTVKKAKKYGKKVGLYASPAMPVNEAIIENVDFIVAKSNELYIIFGEEKREEVLKKYFNKVFVRDDTNSTIYFDGTEMKYFRNDKDKTVYKMGMGDAFTSGFAIALCHGNTIEDCVKFGNEVSARVSGGKGSQTGLPKMSEFFS